MPDAEGSAAAPAKVQFIGRSPAGSNLSEPAVSDGGAQWQPSSPGRSTARWATSSSTSVTDKGVKRVGLPLGGLTSFGKPDLLAGNLKGAPWALWPPTPAAPTSPRRSGPTSGSPTTSRSGPSTRSGTASGCLTWSRDGHGGFWLITGQTGVQVVHVPASLAMQTYPDDQIELSDRISSRLEMGLAAIPKPFTLLTAFDSAKGVWVHVGTTPGQRARHPRRSRPVRTSRGSEREPARSARHRYASGELRQRRRPAPLRSVPHGRGLRAASR